MTRVLRAISVLALLAAGAILARCVALWSQPQLTDDSPGSVQMFIQREQGTTPQTQQVPPLLAAAQAFASYLNPPPPPAKEPSAVATTPVVEEKPKEVVPTIRPPNASPNFKLRGTIYCADQPQRSLALIWEPGSTDDGHWVKEGTQVGHFVIHEVRPGSVVYRAGAQLCEMAVEHESLSQTTIVQENRPATTSPRAAVNNADKVPPAGPSQWPRNGTSRTVGSARTSALN